MEILKKVGSLTKKSVRMAVPSLDFLMPLIHSHGTIHSDSTPLMIRTLLDRW